MANQARVTSTDALESFRVSLIVFLTKAQRCVDDVGDEVRRTRAWLQHDQRVHWEGELRRRTKLLGQAEQELMSARMTGNNEAALLLRQRAVAKARREIEECEEKIGALKRWTRNYDTSVDPAAKKLESLRQFLTIEMPKAIAYLANAQKTLDAYAAAQAPSTETSPATTTPVEPQDQP